MTKSKKFYFSLFMSLALILVPSQTVYALSLDAALANDTSQEGDGVDQDDVLSVYFDDDVDNTTEVTATNVADFFASSTSFGDVDSVTWSGSTVLHIEFGTGSHSIDKGDSLRPETTGTTVFEDSSSDPITSNSVTILGTFDRQWDQQDTNGDANDVFVDGDYLYVADGEEGLYVVDISDPEAMVEGDSMELDGGTAYGVYVDDDYAYVCNGDDGMHIVDVSDPDDLPDDGKEEDKEDVDGDCLDIFVEGDYAYLATDQGLAIIEIDEDEIKDVTESGFEEGFDGDVVDVYVKGDYAYLAVDDADNGLVVVDISTPGSLESDDVVASEETSEPATGIYVVGDYAYVSVGSEGLESFDISDPTDVQSVEENDDVDDSANSVFIDDDYAFLADGENGFAAMEVDEKDGGVKDTDEKVEWNLDGSDECVSVVVDDGWAYLACEGSGVYAIDVDDMSSGSSGGSGDGPDYTDGDLYVYQSYEGDDSDGSREKPYTNIEDALDEADSNDEIFVFPGTYEEDITIETKGVQLIGVGPAFVTIEGSDEVVTIDEDDVELKGFTISGGNIGVDVQSSNEGIIISNNVILNTDDNGVHIEDAEVDLINNVITQNDGNAVEIEGDPTVDVRNNIFDDNKGWGLTVEDDTNITNEYNLYNDNDDGDRETVSAGTGEETGEDPDFDDEDDDDFDWDDDNDDDDFMLGSGSIAEDNGDAASKYEDNDESENDMGAYGGPSGQYDDGDNPDEIDDLAATVSGLTVTLTWDENSENDLFGYYIERSTSETSGYSMLTDMPVIGAEYIDETTSADTYYYRVTTVDLFEDESDESDSLEVSTTGTTPGPDPTPTFSDVPASHEFYDYIIDLKDSGVTNGYPDGTFKPLRDVTRAEFMKMALLAANLDSSAYATQPSCFLDMVDTHSLKQYVCYALAHNFVSGVSGRFYPERDISRFEAMKILLNVNGITGINAVTSSFSDVMIAEQIRYIEKGVELNLVGGYGNGRFGPNNLMLRQEAAKVISKMRTYRAL